MGKWIQIGSRVRFQLTGYNTIYRQKAKFLEFIIIVSYCSIVMRKGNNY